MFVYFDVKSIRCRPTGCLLLLYDGLVDQLCVGSLRSGSHLGKYEIVIGTLFSVHRTISISHSGYLMQYTV